MAGDQRWSPSRVLSPPCPAADAPPLPLPLARKAALRASTQRACSSADAGSSRSMPRTAGQKQRDGTGRGSVNSRVQTASRPIAARCCLAACFCVTAALRCWQLCCCLPACLCPAPGSCQAARRGCSPPPASPRSAGACGRGRWGTAALQGREEGRAGMVGQRGRCMNTTYRGRRAGHVTGVCSQWLGTPRWQCPLPRPLPRPAPWSCAPALPPAPGLSWMRRTEPPCLKLHFTQALCTTQPCRHRAGGGAAGRGMRWSEVGGEEGTGGAARRQARPVLLNHVRHWRDQATCTCRPPCCRLPPTLRMVASRAPLEATASSGVQASSALPAPGVGSQAMAAVRSSDSEPKASARHPAQAAAM